jgi:hypothetical protein
VSTIEAALRGGAVALLALLALAGLRDRWRTSASRYGELLATSVAAYAIQSAPDPRLQAAWVIPLRLIGIGTPAVFWLWAAACFDDEFLPSWSKILPWVALVALGARASSAAGRDHLRPPVRHLARRARRAPLPLWPGRAAAREQPRADRLPRMDRAGARFMGGAQLARRLASAVQPALARLTPSTRRGLSAGTAAIDASRISRLIPGSRPQPGNSGDFVGRDFPVQPT